MTPSSLNPAVSNFNLLGAPPGDLVLRLRNTAQAGRHMRLSAAKCSIGSARDATLRLHGVGVAPTHCLILRGRNQTVVRRWAKNTRLNDRPFTDSPLKIGDRLGLGPLELEIVADTGADATDAETTINLAIADKAAAQTNLVERQNEIAQERRALEADQAAFAQRREALECERQAIEQLQRDLESREQAIAAERRALQADSESIRAAAGESLDTERQSLDMQKQSLATERDTFSSERQSLAKEQDRIADERSAVVADRQKLSRDREALKVEWQTFDMQLQGLSAERQIIASQRQSLEQQQQRLSNEQQALETARQMLDSDRRALDSQKAQSSSETAQNTQHVAEQLAALAASRDAFEEQREVWQFERNQLEARLAEELDHCQRQLAHLNQLQQDLDRERTTWDEHRQATEADLASRREILDRQTTELEAHGCRLEQQQTALAARESSLALRGTTQSTDTPVSSANAGGVATGQVAPASPSPSPSGDGDEARSEEEVFARLRAYSLLKPESQEDKLTGARPSQMAAAGEVDESYGAAAPDAEHARPAEPARVTPPTHAPDEEESVDDYMARLLNRIRGISGPIEKAPVIRPEPRPAPVAPPPAAVSPETAASDDDQQADSPTSGIAPSPVQLVARSAPPESAVNLKAMRDLANMTARGAIDKHAHGRWSKALIGKIIGGLVSFSCGVWLIFSQSSALGALSRFIGLFGIIAGLFWISQAAWFARNLQLAGRRTSKFLDGEAQASDHAGQESADESEPVVQDPAAK